MYRIKPLLPLAAFVCAWIGCLAPHMALAQGCAGTVTITYSPLPTNGTYPPGQLVQICVTMTGYSQNGAVWFDGLDFDFPPGSGFVLPPVSTTPSPTMGGGGGTWGWYTSITGQASGQTWGPGFFFDLNNDGNPGNDFGDNCQTCTWTFCATFQVNPAGPAGAPLNFNYNILGDYSAGSWGSTVCPPVTFTGLPGVVIGGGNCVDPQMSLQATNVACTGVSNGSITASLANPGANPTWQYSINGTNFQASPTFTGLAAGNYTVTVKNDSNCTYTASIAIGTHNPQIATNVVGESCQGQANGSITATVGNPGPYTWQYGLNGGPLGASNVFGGLSAGSYTLLVQNSAGCQYTYNLTVQAPPPLTVTAPNDTTVCPSTPASLTATAGGGTPAVGVGAYSFAWSLNGTPVGTGASLPLAGLPLGLNVYVVTVTDGCSPPATDTVRVTAPQSISINASNDTTICEGQSVTLSVTVSGPGTALGYNWVYLGDPIGSGASVTVSPGVGTNVYYVFVNDSCVTLVDSVTIYVDPAPSSAFLLPPAACVTDVVPITFQGFPVIGLQYEWVFGGNANPSAAFGPFSQNVTWNNPGNKDVTLTAYNAACTTTTTQTINVTTFPVVNAGPDVLICAGDSLTLQGTTNQADLTGCTITWTDLNSGATLTGGLNPVVTPTLSTAYQLVVQCGSCVSLPDVVNITAQPLPVATVAAANVAFCAGDSGVSISGSATGGTGPGTYNFEWVPATGLTDAFSAATTAGPTVTTAYSLFATDANGCTSLPAVVTVTVNPLPIPNAGPDQFTCNQNPVVLQGSATAGSGNYAFSWLPTAHLSNPASATPAATPDTSIVYTLSVTDLTTGCANTLADPLSQVTVFVVAPTQAEAGPAQVTVCAGDSVWIGHPTLGTVPGLTYTWSPATGLANPASGYTRAAPAATTTYTLSVSEGACLGLPDAITVNVLPAPVVSLQDPQGPFCVRTSFTPNYSVVGGVAPLAYQWLVQGSLATAYTGPAPTFVADSSFVLGLRVVDAQGCAGEAFAYVDVTPEPPLSAGPDVSYCATALTQGITLNADFAGTSATWLAPINLSIPNPLVNPSETQQYVLRGVYANNCQVFDTVTVFVLPGIVPSISASDTDVCSGTPIWLSASGGVGAATFQWSPTAGLESPTSANTVANPKGVGLADTLVYTVTVAEGGCSADTSIRVVVRPTPLVDFLPSTLSACLPATQVGFLNATQNAIEYAWNFGDGTTDTTAQPLHTYTQPGSYAVTLTAWSDPSRHCFAQATFPVPVVIHDSLLARIATTLLGPTDTLWLPNGATQFADASTGSTASFWDFGDGQSATGANVTHRYQTPGDYTVTLIAENAGGCRDTVTYTPVVVRQEVLLPIPNVFTPNGDGYNDVFRVLYTGTQPFRLTITDRWGVHVFDADTPSQGWEASNAPAGVYYYRLKIGDRVILGSVTLLR